MSGRPGPKVFLRNRFTISMPFAMPCLPFVTMFGLILPGLIGGSVIIESIFSWPGMGRMAYEAILARDYPIVLTENFIAAVLVLIGTFISDVLYMVVDPRIRL